MLHKALVDLKDWVDDGRPEHYIFKPYRSVCVCVGHYLESKCSEGSFHRNMSELSNLMNYKSCPFNDCLGNWTTELEEASFYQNSKRLEWLAKHGRRTISDCVPLVLSTTNPSYNVVVNIYNRNGQRHALPCIWAIARNLGIARAPRELRENTIRYLVSLEIEVDHAL